MSCAHKVDASVPAKRNKTIFFTGYDLIIKRKFKVKIYIMTSTVVYEGNLRTVCTHVKSGSVIETDAPRDNQGLAVRFSPTDMVAPALGTCMLTIMGIKARDMDVDINGIKIEVELISSNQPAGGISGLGMAVLAPAVANELAAGTGRRLRNLPFDPMSAP